MITIFGHRFQYDLEKYCLKYIAINDIITPKYYKESEYIDF